MHDYEDDDMDGSEEREALSMVLGNLGDAVKGMRRKRLMRPAQVKVVKVDSLSPDDPLAEGDAELSEDELAKLEELC